MNSKSEDINRISEPEQSYNDLLDFLGLTEDDWLTLLGVAQNELLVLHDVLLDEHEDLAAVERVKKGLLRTEYLLESIERTLVDKFMPEKDEKAGHA